MRDLNHAAQNAFWIGTLIGFVCAVALCWILWRLPVHQARFMDRKTVARHRATEDHVSFFEELKKIPLRSMEDIAEDREPEWVQPVMAKGMEPEVPAPPPPKLSFTGPPMWRMWSWIQWNCGDLLSFWSTYGTEQDSSRHRLLRSMRQAQLPEPS